MEKQNNQAGNSKGEGFFDQERVKRSVSPTLRSSFLFGFELKLGDPPQLFRNDRPEGQRALGMARVAGILSEISYTAIPTFKPAYST